MVLFVVNDLGFVGAALLAFCALPQLIMTIKDGHAYGMSILFLLAWYLGEIFTLIYIVDKIGIEGPLFLNYAANTAMLTVIMYYKLFPRR